MVRGLLWAGISWAVAGLVLVWKYLSNNFSQFFNFSVIARIPYSLQPPLNQDDLKEKGLTQVKDKLNLKTNSVVRCLQLEKGRAKDD